MNSITRAFDQALGLPTDFCMTCWGPITDPGPVVIHLGQDEAVFTCESCGRKTDADGRCIDRVSTGPVVEIIEIELEPPEDP